jgi:pantoate--beta-alanine ligase
MPIINSVKDMQRYSDTLRRQNKRVAVVPTMGYLHEGHVSLMRIAREHADAVIVTIFVNPTQFGPNEDFTTYPRDWDRDVKLVTSSGADCMYAPAPEEMYPAGYQTSVRVDKLTQHLCGIVRPTHFEGVTTVVTKLFNATKAHVAVFGEKDFQQLQVIRRMVRDLDVDIEIIGAPIVREPDGIAMSSRNKYLSAEERTAALVLSRSLFELQDMCAQGERDALKLSLHVWQNISADPLAKIDYIKVCDLETLEDVTHIRRDAVVALAVFFGKTRLIDNIVVHIN